jgi:hypothetical protein
MITRYAKFELDLKTVSEANSSEHWSKSSKRHNFQQLLIARAFASLDSPIELPCTVNLTRLSPRELDDDNLRTAFKWIRDEIADQLLPEQLKYYTDKKGKLRAKKGVSDNDPRITWSYSQNKAHRQGIIIEVVSDVP